MVGVGANFNLLTSITGNQFQATVPNPVDPREEALLRVTGDKIDKTFNVAANHDEVVADWNIANIGRFDAQFAADFLTAATIDQVLAENLEVFYTVGDGPERRAGTLADSTELTAVTGLSDVLKVGEDVDVQVRIVLPNPAELLVTDTEIDQVLNVAADWDVRYLTIVADEDEDEDEDETDA
ncbi:hypothetical protein Sked_34120 [Sanguibacter keddieii DSM 10542]|uniref:Uncharacterized protein n=2 Tax=Sanguibacter keddieii TaxID=60920 RepID=D1BEL7_SANKS|nr:hypothetical protein Sked_34120 [Sanguibacter keddieii DSM 10542]